MSKKSRRRHVIKSARSLLKNRENNVIQNYNAAFKARDAKKLCQHPNAVFKSSHPWQKPDGRAMITEMWYCPDCKVAFPVDGQVR